IYRLGLFGDRFSINDVVKEIYEKEKEKNMSKIWELKDDGNVKETAGELLRLKAANTKATKEDWDRLKKSVTLESVDLDVADVIMYAIDNCNHEVFITCYENSTCVTIKPVKEN
ncbi:MAG: hypothetical protein IIX06_02035, partial [Bacteroidales bacterium]|nr:hypothetical protein [Bacteroidales bacterium]